MAAAAATVNVLSTSSPSLTNEIEGRLVDVIHSGNLKDVQGILDANSHLNINSLLTVGPEKCTPLYLVCADNSEHAEDTVLELLEMGADINKPSLVEMKDEFDDVVSALALGAASTDVPSGGKKIENELPLDAATHNKNLTLSLLLLDHGSKMTAKSAARFRKVKELNLAGRGLTTVPAWLEEFKGLRRLNLSDNRLTALPTFLANIKSLEHLNLAGNPLESIPSEVKSGSLKGILVYLRQLAKSQAKWTRIKLMLVGKENVGKTTLLHCLSTLLLNPKAAKKSASDLFAATARGKKIPAHLRHMPLSTDGIGMGELSTRAWVTARRKGKTEPVTFQTYDFGGQMVFYPTHQLFLTARSIYLVVFNVVEDDRTHVLYWLKQVRASTHGEETPIVVVGTHIDHPNAPDAQALSAIGKQLQRTEGHVRKVCYVSCKTGDGLEELMDAIVDLADRHSFIKQFVPGSYYTLHQTLTNLRTGVVKSESRPDAEEQQQVAHVGSTAFGTSKEASARRGLPWTTWEHLVTLAEGCGINSEELVEVSRFLHDAGTLVHFDDAYSGLQDLVVIDAQWLADVMKSIISFNNKWVKNGAITLRELYNWAWRDYPATIRPALQRIFEKFQIIFPLRLEHRLADDNDDAQKEQKEQTEQTEQKEDEDKAKQEELSPRPSIADKRFMVPSLLPEDPVEEVLSKAWPTVKPEGVIEYSRIYELSDFIPIGLFARLIVRMLHIPDVRLLAAWRTGLVIEADEPQASSPSSGEPAKYQALVRQLDKPEYKIEVLVRVAAADLAEHADDAVNGHAKAERKDKHKGKDKGGRDDEDERAAQDKARQQPEQKLCSSVLLQGAKTKDAPRDTKAAAKIHLLEQVIYLIDVLLQGYTGGSLQVARKVPCSLPFADDDQRHCSHLFAYAECVESVMLDRQVWCPVHEASVSVRRLAPDLALGSVRLIEESELRKGSQIGQGGYGLVYKATWNNSPVALKLLLVKNHGEEEQTEQQSTRQYDEFKHEAFLMSCLEHENVIRLYGICYSPLGMVMEFAGRGDLHDLLESLQKATVIKAPYSLVDGKHQLLPLQADEKVIVRGKKKKTNLYEVETMYGQQGLFPTDLIRLSKAPLTDEAIPWPLRWRIALDVAKGMTYLHSFQPPIVHRDLRSPNVFMVSHDPGAKTVAKVGDFGLARHVDPRLHEGLPTWQWLAPEILDHDNTEYDERSDIYSFGIVMYEIASRKLPYTEEYWSRFQRNGYFQAKDCQNAIVKDQLRPTPPADCPPAFAKLMQACWAHNPHDRPAFAEVVCALAAHVEPAESASG